MMSKFSERFRGVGALLALATLSGASQAATLAVAQDAPPQHPVARAELGGASGQRLVVSLEGGAPWGRALLCLESAQGRVVQPVQLDGQGGYRRELPAPGLRAALRLSFRAGPSLWDPSGEGLSSNRVMVPGLPAWNVPVLGGGRLVVSEIMKNPAAVPDSVGEWIEVYNAGDTALDLEGWSLSDLGSNFHVISVGGAGLMLQPGARLVLGNNDDPNLNGGVAVDYRYSSFTLSNTADDVLVHTPGGALVDGVSYHGASTWPNTPGVSMSLSAQSHDAQANDDPSHWCDAISPVSPGSGDLGSPGQRNGTCP